jgi:hypothetical protein
MAELGDKRNRLTVKLVYYWPALSGKTTNLTRSQTCWRQN